MDIPDHESDNEIVSEEVNIQEEEYAVGDYEIAEGNEIREVEGEENDESFDAVQEDVITQKNDVNEGEQGDYQDSGVVVHETIEDQQEYEEVYEPQEVAVVEGEFDEAQEIAEEEVDGEVEEIVQEDYPGQDSVQKDEEIDQEEVQEFSEQQELDAEEVGKAGEEEKQEGIEEESGNMEKEAPERDEDETGRDSDNEQEDATVEDVKSQSEDEYDNVVEVEEHKAESDGENENVAQHVSDSENEEDGKIEEVKLGDVSEDDLRGASSGSDNEASEDDNNTTPTKRKNAVLSSDDEDGSTDKASSQRKENAVAKMFDSDSEGEQKEEGVGDLIADIFGESDDEEEFTGFGQEEVTKKPGKPVSNAISDSEEEPDAQESEDEVAPEPKSSKKPLEGAADSDSDEGVRDKSDEMSDFDLMMKRKKEANRRGRRRKDGGTLISDADDIINAMLIKMKESAESDREANQKRQPALKKLKMLPSVIIHLKKQDLKEAFVDNGVIAAIADWLSLLPDRSLPHITIRTELLKILHDLPAVGAETLKQSGIGRSVMILFKHPRETRSNRDMAGRLINKWSRPIFGLNENFKSMTREEREQRDLDQMPQAKRRKLSAGTSQGQGADGRVEGELGQLRPGEQGFVMRARVPMPSTKDYVVRPKWNVQTGADMDEDEPRQVSKRRRSAGAPRSSKKDERLEKHLKNFAERRKNSKLQRAVKISIEGNKMSIV